MHTSAVQAARRSSDTDNRIRLFTSCSCTIPAKPPKINEPAAADRRVRVEVAAIEDLARVVQRVDDRTLAGAVWAEKKRQRLDGDLDPISDALEVLDRDAGDHLETSQNSERRIDELAAIGGLPTRSRAPSTNHQAFRQ